MGYSTHLMIFLAIYVAYLQNKVINTLLFSNNFANSYFKSTKWGHYILLHHVVLMECQLSKVLKQYKKEHGGAHSRSCSWRTHI